MQLNTCVLAWCSRPAIFGNFLSGVNCSDFDVPSKLLCDSSCKVEPTLLTIENNNTHRETVRKYPPIEKILPKRRHLKDNDRFFSSVCVRASTENIDRVVTENDSFEAPTRGGKYRSELCKAKRF